MRRVRTIALTALLIGLGACATTSKDRYYVSGNEQGGDYYLAPAPRDDLYTSYFGFYGWGFPYGSCSWRPTDCWYGYSNWGFSGGPFPPGYLAPSPGIPPTSTPPMETDPGSGHPHPRQHTASLPDRPQPRSPAPAMERREAHQWPSMPMPMPQARSRDRSNGDPTPPN